jgi:hypothetical protein
MSTGSGSSTPRASAISRSNDNASSRRSAGNGFASGLGRGVEVGSGVGEGALVGVPSGVDVALGVAVNATVGVSSGSSSPPEQATASARPRISNSEVPSLQPYPAIRDPTFSSCFAPSLYWWDRLDAGIATG